MAYVLQELVEATQGDGLLIRFRTEWLPVGMLQEILLGLGGLNDDSRTEV